MTKKKVVILICAVVLSVGALLAKPISDRIRESNRYAEFEKHSTIGSQAYFEKDYARAYEAFVAAYDALTAENDNDLAKKADACRLAAECQTNLGDTDGAILTLQRGYDDTQNEALYEKLSAMPVQFAQPQIHEAVCTALDIPQNALTYADLQSVEQISIRVHSVAVYPNRISILEPIVDFNALLLSSETLVDQLSMCQNASVTLGGGYDPVITDISNLYRIKNLHEISFSNDALTDLSFLRGFSALETLYLNSNKITDLTPLAQKNSLLSLSLPGNPLSDLSPLSALDQLDSLDVEGCPVTDFSPVSHIQIVFGKPEKE